LRDDTEMPDITAKIWGMEKGEGYCLSIDQGSKT